MNSRINTRAGRALAVLLIAVLAAAALLARPVSLATPPAESVRAINATELRMHLEFLASREVGGRYTLSPGLGIAARYLATRLAFYGFRGAGAGARSCSPSTSLQLTPSRLGRRWRSN